MTDRIANILEAIDSDDTELYWLDRNTWLFKHGKTIFWNNLKPKKLKIVKDPVPHSYPIDKLQKFRTCVGQFDIDHTFCLNVCTCRNICYNQSPAEVSA